MSHNQDSKSAGIGSETDASTNRRTFMAGLSALAGAAAASQTAGASPGGRRRSGPKRNVIFMIPDGSGRVQDTAARYLKAYRTDVDAFPMSIRDVDLGIDRADAIGSVSTYPDDDQLITDSAAAGTAFATGRKTYSGAISVDTDRRPLETVLERASDAGYATGLVTTTQLTHATPAAFATHVESRGMQAEIARQYVQEADVDVMLGGDRSHFRADDRDDGTDLIGEAKARGYQYVETADELESVDEGKVLGLFSESGHLDYYLDREANPDNTQPGLARMTEIAISLLEERSEKGFFLMVEGGRIDHVGHANDPAMIPEQLEHDDAVDVAMAYAADDEDDHPGRGRGPRWGCSAETLVLNVADHETGGLVLGRDAYDMGWEYVDGQEITQGALAAELESAASRSEIASIVADRTGIDDLSASELDELEATPSAIQGRDSVLNRRAGLSWGSDSHTATDVPVYAKGVNADYFAAHRENSDLVAGIEAVLDLA